MKKLKFTKKWVQKEISEEIYMLSRWKERAELDKDSYAATMFRIKIDALHDILLKLGLKYEVVE